MELYERLETVAKEKGTSVYRITKDLGLSRGIMSSLKAGKSKTLSQKTLSKIAEYLGVSIDYLINGQNDEIKDQNDEIDDFGFAMYNYGKSLTDEQKQLLINLAKSMNTKE